MSAEFQHALLLGCQKMDVILKDAVKEMDAKIRARTVISKLYNCGGLPVDLIIPEEDIWEDQQWCLDLISEHGSPILAHDQIRLFRAAQEYARLIEVRV